MFLILKGHTEKEEQLYKQTCYIFVVFHTEDWIYFKHWD